MSEYPEIDKWRQLAEAELRGKPADSLTWMSPEGIPAHEFHYSRLENIDGALTFAYRMERGQGIDGVHDGIVHRNLLASYAHLRDVAGHHWTRRFVAHVRACKA